MLKQWVERHPIRSRRILEVAPGMVSWSLILFPIWGSLVVPLAVAYYVLAFAIYWLYRSVLVAVLALVGHFRIQAAVRYDWLGDVAVFPDWTEVHHVILIPTFKEPLHTLVRTLKGLQQQTYPKRKLHVVVSFEGREGEEAKIKARELTKEFGRVFGDLVVTSHPEIAGEVKGKSANMAWAAKVAAKEVVRQKKLAVDYVTVTNEDADVILSPNYFACLTYQFLDHPKRWRRIWQPAVMYYNNIWRVPAPIRVLATVWSVVQIYLLTRQETLINFSTYSTSFKMIAKIGFWDTDVIPEDYRLFFKSWFYFKGGIEVEPIWLPALADAAESTSYWRTLANQYQQVKRWAWGVSDNAYVVKQWIAAEKVPVWKKTFWLFKFWEIHFLWPVHWFAITVGAFFPPLLNPVFARTMLGKTLPQVTSTILILSLVALVTVWLVHIRERPKHPDQTSVWRRMLMPFELLLLPILGFFFSFLPGLDAHTRLMLGRYIDYRVTEKV